MKKLGRRKKQRKKQVVLFNHPFNLNVKTTIDKCLFAILKKYFLLGSPFAKVFNKKTVKVSYSCLLSMKTIISSHNEQMLWKTAEEHRGSCNCQSGVETCPLGGQCKLKSIGCNAIIHSEEGGY